MEVKGVNIFWAVDILNSCKDVLNIRRKSLERILLTAGRFGGPDITVDFTDDDILAIGRSDFEPPEIEDGEIRTMSVINTELHEKYNRR